MKTLVTLALLLALAAPAYAVPAPIISTSLECNPTFAHGVLVMFHKYTFADGKPADHYRVFRDGALLGLGTTSAYYYDQQAPGEYHTYNVTAVDVDGRESPHSLDASAIGRDCTNPTIGALRVGVLLVSYAGTPPGVTPADASKAVFTDAARKYATSSWGQVSIPGGLKDVYSASVGQLGDPCDLISLASTARHQANVPNIYDYYVVFGGSCSASLGAGGIALTRLTTHVAHELGHNLGFQHASGGRACSIDSLADTTCQTVSEYGCSLDFMGQAAGTDEVNAPHKEDAGWAQIPLVETSGTYTMIALDRPAKPGEQRPRGIKLYAGPLVVPSYRTRSLVYVEYRAGRGGVVLTVADPFVHGLAGRPSSGYNFWVQTPTNGGFLRPGKSVTFKQGSSTVQLTTLSVDATSATVRVDMKP